MMNLPRIMIIELGSQYTLLIERSLRELGYRSMVVEPKRALALLQVYPVDAVILSGGARSVYDTDAPQPPLELLTWLRADGSPLPVLGICYGMQWLAHTLGGRVQSESGSKEYGEATLAVGAYSELFLGTPSHQKVWMSHGDSVVELPQDFRVTASSGAAIAAMERGSHWGVQFHPEVTHTPHGQQILRNFLRMAGCRADWAPQTLVASMRKDVLVGIGERRSIMAFSGGVDSTTLAALVAPALGDRLQAVVIDGGHLREHEMEEICHHASCAGVELRVLDVRDACARALADTIDAEEKRRRFKRIYVKALREAGHDFGAQVIIQGTLAPDRIESGETGGAMIKSHHNVGLDFGEFRQLHPIGNLYKYEVRALAQELGLPQSVWQRQPFPGPGLFLRIVGVPVTPERLDLVRWADARTREILSRAGVYADISQLVVALIGVNTVGVKGDARCYGGALVVRAIQTADFMTAHGVHLSDAVEDELSAVLTAHPQIVRVWFDGTKKPPATTEME